jgi:hypothetical protein
LRDLVEINAYKEGCVSLSNGKSTTAIVDLAGALTTIARHHLRLDKDYLDRMAIKRLSIGRRGITEKDRNLLRQFDDPDKS